MSDDASTAYICIYCPFNSDNLEALENHLASMKSYPLCHLDLLVYIRIYIHLQGRMSMGIKNHSRYQHNHHHHYLHHRTLLTRPVNAKYLTMNRYPLYFNRHCFLLLFIFTSRHLHHWMISNKQQVFNLFFCIWLSNSLNHHIH